MTEEEKKFATSNHDLIYKFYHQYTGYDLDDFYIIVAEGYLHAVMTWFSRKDLRESCKFSTIAYRCMRSRLINSHNRQCSVKTSISLDDKLIGGEGEELNYRYEVVPNGYDLHEDFSNTYLYENIRKELKEKDLIAFDMLLSGHTTYEIGDALGCSHQNVKYIKERIQKVARKYIK